MQIDELKRELTSLADEIEPFAGDVQGLHRRERRRRVVTTTLAAGLVVIVAVATIAVVRHTNDGRIHVSGVGSKEVPSAEMTHVDAIVVPATPAVRAILDASSAVGRYALLIQARRPPPLATADVRAGVCALQSSAGFAVEAATPEASIQASLTHDLAGHAQVYETIDSMGSDLEVFMRVGASSAQAAAIRARLAGDQNVSAFRDVTPTDAYVIFRRDFADQPALVQSTKPSDLPESFRIDLTRGTSVETMVERYEHADGVDITITFSPGTRAALFDPSSPANPLRGVGDACTKP